MSTHRRPVIAPRAHRRVEMPRGDRSWTRRPWSHRLLPVGLGLAVLGVGGVVGPSVVEEVSGGDSQRLELTALPKDNPGQGLVYEGLAAAKADAICAGTYQLDDQTCTHGPDPAPPGLSVRRDVAPVTSKAPEPVQPTQESATVPGDAEIARDEGGSALTADAPALVPDAAPGEADFVMGNQGVACESDGRSGKRVQVLYLHEFGSPSRYTDFLGSIRTWTAGADQIFDQSAGETGGSRHVRFVTTPQCRVDVAEVQLPPEALSSFAKSVRALQALGYNRTDRKYMMFADANVYCGIATYIADRRAGLGNRNNGGPSYGRVDAGCWSSVMAARELTQTLGAVLIGSPNASGAGGCLDEYDLLCGEDRSGKPLRNVCPKKHENRLDCGHDDYFSTNPRPGSYLARNWNIATSEFLLRSDGGDDIPDAGPAPEAPAGPATPPATPATAAPTTGGPTGPAGPAGEPSADVSYDPGAADGGGDAPPSPEATATPAQPPTSAPVSAEPVQGKVQPIVTQSVAAQPVQAVLEIRDATSSSVRLSWSAASSTATYEVWVGNSPIATTKATRARLIGLRPDGKYVVTIKSGKTYAAKATAETAPAARPAQNTWFTLTNALTGGAADLYAARTANGTPLTLAETDGNAQQQWQLVPAGDGKSYSLVSRATGKCVAPLGGNPVAGTPLVQGDCGTDDGARWQLQASDYGFTLRTTVGDLVAGVGEQRFGAHRVLVLQNGNGQRHQSWTAVPD
ncbi:RICIN domain-containing protein [Actinoplanes sp. CA-030573]|uniref:RICIN domain-containing protein n=1 Tax=Actinoplanes sp. CA-030573 TaxID=3239898 RepID=UPI003D8E2830